MRRARTARSRSPRTSGPAGGRRPSRRPAGRAAQPLGQVVAEPVGVDPRDEHGRGQDDDEHTQRDGEGRVEVAAGEQPGRPADRERRDEAGQHPHGDPTGPPVAGPRPGRREADDGEQAWSARTARLVVQCGDRTPAGRPASRREQGEGAAPGEQRGDGRCRWLALRRGAELVDVVARSTTWRRGSPRRRRPRPTGMPRRGRRRRPTCAGPDRPSARRRAAPMDRGGGRRHRQPPLLPAGQVARVGGGEVGQPEGREEARARSTSVARPSPGPAR